MKPIFKIFLNISYCLFLFSFTYCDQQINETNRCQFGINALKPFHIPNELYTTVSTRMGYMHELGVRWDRSDFLWHRIEPKQGTFDFSFPDNAIAFYEKNKIQMFPILCYHSNWAKDGTSPATKEEQKLFANYVYECVKRYKNRITYWELWNEPNILPFWKPNPNAAHYAALLKQSYLAAKKANPNCKIVGVCMAGYDPEFLERLYQLGGKDYFDILSYHYYRTIPPEYEVPKELEELHNLMARYGDGNKRIWITEMGVSSHPILGVSEEKQAAYLVRNHIICFGSGYVDRFFQFDMINWTDDTTSTWDGMLGLMKVSGGRKPSFYAYQTMVTQLSNAKIIGKVPIEGVEAYLFKKDGKYTLVYWTIKGEKKFSLSAKHKQVTLINLYGKKEVKLNPTVTLELTATELPTYLLDAPKELILSASFKVSPASLELVPGEKKETVVELQNPFPKPIIGTLRWTNTPGISVTPQFMKLVIPAGKKIQRKFTITSGKDVSETEYPISCRFDSVAPLVKNVSVMIKPAFEIMVRPMQDITKYIRVIVRTTNMLQQPVDGTISFTLADNKTNVELGYISFKKLNPRQQTDFQFIYDAQKFLEVAEPFNINVQFTPLGTSRSRQEKWRSKTVSFPVAIQPMVTSLPNIDGILDEWASIPSVELNRPQQVLRGNKTWTSYKLHAQVKLAWTKSDVYFAAEARDIDPGYNLFSGNDLWRGDAFELYLGTAGPELQRYYSKSDFQIGISTGTETTKPFIYNWTKEHEITNAEIIIHRFPGKYIIESRIPLDELNGFIPSPDTIIGFDVALDDLNRNEKIDYAAPPEGRSLMWHGTNMNWQNPSNWGIAIIK